MAINLTSPVTGGAQTGLTSPTYTVALDVAPTPQGKQYAVTALGGTQTGVTTHSPSNPFSTTVVKPAAYKMAPVPNPSNGMVREAAKNKFKVITRKGAPVVAGTPAQLVLINTEFSVPAGAESVSIAEVRAALSLHIGVLNQLSASLGDLVATGVM